MVKFRRSRSEKESIKPSHISIPPKDAIAIVPPKKVIKALYEWRAPEGDQNTIYLSFAQGDFLHVVGRENDTEWYEACNPLQGSRGLVPAKFFETVGKTVRDSGDSSSSLSNKSNPGHDSGYAEKTPTAIAGMGMMDLAAAQEMMKQQGQQPLRLSKALGRGGAMIYGVVMYDFKAERPDELEAKEGEAIIVIAQSTPEWFVAKPITRLGGPGLIPVSFIEVRDMTTGAAVTDTQDAVSRAGIPKVEEWKKMAADYKNGSIPLGKFDSSAMSAMNAMNAMNPQGQQGQQGMERMSLSSRQEPNGYGPQRTSQGQVPRPFENNILIPLKASVPRYCFADDVFWFIVEAQMEDGRHWCLSRLYQDFYDLQIQLIQEFPKEAGNVKGVDRSLPYMPGPVNYVTDNISSGRRANLDEYIANLLKLGPHISRSYTVRKFFEPRGEDYEIDPNVDANYRLSATSQGSTQGPSQGASRQSSQGNIRPQITYSQTSTPSNHYRGQSDGQPPMLRHNSAMTAISSVSAQSGAGGSAMKIKVWFEEDNCVVIRMPQTFRFADLYKKLKERRALERPEESDFDLVVRWRDESLGELRELRGDADLSEALSRGERLALTVDVR